MHQHDSHVGTKFYAYKRLADFNLSLTIIPTDAARKALMNPPIINGVNPPANAANQEISAANFNQAVPISKVINIPIMLAKIACGNVKLVFSR